MAVEIFNEPASMNNVPDLGVELGDYFHTN